MLTTTTALEKEKKELMKKVNILLESFTKQSGIKRPFMAHLPCSKIIS